MSALCSAVSNTVTGKFDMYALIALGLVAGLFAVLNLIDFGRLD